MQAARLTRAFPAHRTGRADIARLDRPEPGQRDALDRSESGAAAVQRDRRVPPVAHFQEERFQFLELVVHVRDSNEIS